MVFKKVYFVCLFVCFFIHFFLCGWFYVRACVRAYPCVSVCQKEYFFTKMKFKWKRNCSGYFFLISFSVKRSKGSSKKLNKIMNSTNKVLISYLITTVSYHGFFCLYLYVCFLFVCFCFTFILFLFVLRFMVPFNLIKSPG